MINNTHAETQLKRRITNPFSLTTSERALSWSIIACAELEFRFASGPVSIISKLWTRSLNSWQKGHGLGRKHASGVWNSTVWLVYECINELILITCTTKWPLVPNAKTRIVASGSKKPVAVIIVTPWKIFHPWFLMQMRRFWELGQSETRIVMSRGY